MKRKKKLPIFRHTLIEDITENNTTTTITPKTKSNPYYKEMTPQLNAFLNKNKPKTWGDALGIIHDLQHSKQYDEIVKFAGTLGESQFMTNLLWHISTIGPQESIKYQN